MMQDVGDREIIRKGAVDQHEGCAGNGKKGGDAGAAGSLGQAFRGDGVGHIFAAGYSNLPQRDRSSEEGIRAEGEREQECETS
jgi:hypothetical protein